MQNRFDSFIDLSSLICCITCLEATLHALRYVWHKRSHKGKKLTILRSAWGNMLLTTTISNCTPALQVLFD